MFINNYYIISIDGLINEGAAESHGRPIEALA